MTVKTNMLRARKRQDSSITLQTEEREPSDYVSSLQTFSTGSELVHGNMFNIRTLTDISVLYLDIQTSQFTNVTYSAFTKSGSYIGHEHSSDDWVLLVNGTASGDDGRHGILTNRLNPSLFIPANSTQAFYITLNKPEMMASLGSEIGSKVVADSNIEIQEGIGVMGYSFGETIQAPQIFNGAIHYTTNITNHEDSLVDVSHEPQIHSGIHSQDNQSLEARSHEHETYMRSRVHDFEPPATVPGNTSQELPEALIESNSSSASLASEAITEVSYVFKILYLPQIEISEVLKKVESSISNSLTSQLEHHGINEDLIIVGVKANVNTSPLITEYYCRGVEEGNKCSSVESTVLVGHSGRISNQEVKDLFRSYTNTVSDNLGFSNDVLDLGKRHVSSPFAIHLYGTDLEQMNAIEVVIFEDETSNFLNECFVAMNYTMHITSIDVSSQIVYDLESSSSAAYDNLGSRLKEIPPSSRDMTLNETFKAPNLDSIADMPSTDPTNAIVTFNAARNDSKVNSTNTAMTVIMLIKGEYQPPPMIDLNSISKDAMLERNHAYVQVLNSQPFFLDRVAKAEIYQNNQSYKSAIKIIPSDISSNLQYLYSLFGLILFIVCGRYLYKRRRRAKKKVTTNLRDMKNLVQTTNFSVSMRSWGNLKEHNWHS